MNPAPAAYGIERLSLRPDLMPEVDALIRAVWPSFVGATDSSGRFWRALGEELADYQVVVTDQAGGVQACGHSIPAWWDRSVAGLPTGWDDVLAQGVLRHRAGAAVNTLSALAVSVHPRARGQGLPGRIIAEMKSVAAAHRLDAFIAPVRPTRKAEHPDMPIEDYVAWRREDGQHHDPWLRLHERLGGRILAVAPRSMVVSASLSEWERWTQVAFGPGVEAVYVPGGLSPVRIQGGSAVYVEPNVWMVHPMTETPSTARWH